MSKNSLKVLYLSAEVFPYVKVGGLADVAGSLPKELSRRGCDIRVIMPKYRHISLPSDAKLTAFPSTLTVSTGSGHMYFPKLWETQLPESTVPLYLLDEPVFFDRDSVYGYSDDPERFCTFAKASLEACKHIDFKPDIIHINDWQSALIPLMIKVLYKDDVFFANTKTLLTIHNLRFQGATDKKILDFVQIPANSFASLQDDIADGDVNLLYEGILHADAINTVSSQYAKEVLTSEYGEGLHAVLEARKENFSGILNGINTDIWNPEKDPHISQKYGVKNISLKRGNTEALRESLKLEDTGMPLFGMVTRLSRQKGFYLIEEVQEKLFESEFQLVVLGLGDPDIHRFLEEMEIKHPSRLRFIPKFDENLAHKIYAGADFLLMPSHFEPCGLSQMIAMRYGTIPIVYKTGGLAETVEGYHPSKQSGDGFVFNEYTPDALLGVIDHALKLYDDKKDFLKLQNTIMRKDFSWKKSAGEYLEVYRGLLN